MNSNNWQLHMYDTLFARTTLNSAAALEKAKSEADFLIRTLALPQNASILDVPCGAGRHALQFAEKGYNVLGQAP